MIHDLPISERPREKLLKFGSGSLSNSELIAILISSGSKNESAISLASKVLSLEQGSISKLSGYEPEELMNLKGIGIAKACSLLAAMELGRRIATTPREERINIKNSDMLARLFMEDMKYLKKEVVKIVILDVHNCIIARQDISIGSISEAGSHPREIFAPAIKKGANTIVVAHNHPSGDPTPSNGDMSSTKQIVESGKILGIPVLDHIIIGDNRYISMKEDCKGIFT